jgi:hypothetical protein
MGAKQTAANVLPLPQGVGRGEGLLNASSQLPLTRREFARRTLVGAGLTLAGFQVQAAPEQAVRHRFLCCDYQGNKVAIVGNDGSVEWEFAAETPQDCWLLPNGNVLFCHHHGAKEVTPEKRVVWEYQAPAQAECHSCQPLAGGQVLVAECGLGRLVEIGRDGRIAREIRVPSSAKNMSHQFRGCRQTANGHYWVCLMDEKKIVELSPESALLREIRVEGFPHEAILLPNGNLLVTLGQAGKVIELDQDLRVAWELGETELPGNALRLPAGCQRLPNGNTIICNYLPGPFVGKQPQAFEVTRDKKVVWEFADHAHFKTVNQICLLDLPGSGKSSPMLR